MVGKAVYKKLARTIGGEVAKAYLYGGQVSKDNFKKLEALKYSLKKKQEAVLFNGMERGTWRDEATAQKYYALGREWRKLDVIRNKTELLKPVSGGISPAAIALREKVKIKEANATSTTYERAKKRREIEVKKFLNL